MSTIGKEVFRDCLSSKEGMQLINVKFFRGYKDVISEEEFCNELCASAERRRNGKVVAGGMPKRKKAPIDLRAYVANL